jgi:hypothetical protein
VKATHAKSVLKAKVVPVTSVPPKAMAPSLAAMSKVAATVTTLGVGVLKISTGMKRSSAAPSPVVKGKQARLDVRPLSTYVAPCKVLA